MTVHIRCSIAEKIGFASHQHSVPVLRELELVHLGDTQLNDLVLTLTASPSFLVRKTWQIDRLNPGVTLTITDRNLMLDATLLSSLTEAVSGQVIIQLRQGDQLLASASVSTQVLAKYEWGGSESMPGLLAAFVMPNDPAVDGVLRQTSDVLRRSGQPDAIEGYQRGERQRVWEIAAAIWSALCQQSIRSVLPPASFEYGGQKVRPPGNVLEHRVATCLDSALLFAAALEQAGLNPVLVLTRGHAMAGAWLQPQEFPHLLIDDAATVRKRIDLQDLIVFETTLVMEANPPLFSQAIRAASHTLQDDDAFVMALDIRRARMQRILPLPVVVTAPSAMGGESVQHRPLEPAPRLPAFDSEESGMAAGPLDKLAMWQRKLLDLTARNRLLHLPESSKAVPLLCPAPTQLEDLLSAGKRVKIVPLPELDLAGRNAALYHQQHQTDLQAQLAKAALGRAEVLSPLAADKLDALLVDLYRKAKSDLDEGGANTLFLALGFLNWHKHGDSRIYRAPLILLPVKLERKSALSGVVMTLGEDEPRFNLTLLELLRHDFELNIAGLEGELPRDESGVDVEGVWHIIRRAVQDLPGFEVVTDLALGTFSFAKYLMWKDLVDRADQLIGNPVVNHLIHGNGVAYPTHGGFPNAHRLDETIAPEQLFTPLPTDSSQLAAIVASAQGHNFVLDGPPGTGKSQTIANMIAHNLALGRRVLFVAEKMAALNVVYRRLAEKGLGEFCLELHSSKASKTEVLKQLDRAWDARDSLSDEAWAKEAAEVQRLQARLNSFIQRLHEPWPNGWTIFQAIGRVIRDDRPGLPVLQWPADHVHDEPTWQRLREAVRRLALNAGVLATRAPGLQRLTRTEWSNAWQQTVCLAAPALLTALAQLQQLVKQLVDQLHLPPVPMQPVAVEQLVRLGQWLPKAHGLNLSVAFSSDAVATLEVAQTALTQLASYQQLSQTLSVRYPADAWRRIDLAQLERDWATASGRFWFLADWAKKKLAQRLMAQLALPALPDLARDLPILRQLVSCMNTLDAMSPKLAGVSGWDTTNSDLTRLKQSIEMAETIRQMMRQMSTTPEQLMSLRQSLSRVIIDANALLAPGAAIATTANQLEQTWRDCQDKAQQFITQAALAPALSQDWRAMHEVALTIHQHAGQLKAWCDWQRARQEALSLGLQPLLTALEQGLLSGRELEDAFEISYARWFAANRIDADPMLRQFVALEHMHDIDTYRKLDDRLSQLAVRYTRARLCGQIPARAEVSKQDGFAVLKHELQKQRRHKPIRQLASEMGEALPRLAPCMLMSPLSIAQYLPPNQTLFDLVIFDEASQIAPWDAIGAIARGAQVVVAGDPRQMPPTSFFSRNSNDEEETAADLESILDQCLAAGIPRHSLTWHYRSRHESLIAFSNHRYYDNQLITFPASVTRHSAVEWHRVEGVYAKGKGRTNAIEAKAMADEVVKRLTDPAFVRAGYSIGIVTLNEEQCALVENLLDKARQQQPELERFFGDATTEPVVVKSLEKVQGDERDVILLGVGYGPTEPGAPVMSMNFGPLNREGGWRRLNVAITRARRELLVFTSFDPYMIDLHRTSARAVHDLKHFLEFAQRGPRALAEQVRGSVGSYDSPFEEAVANALRERGWQVVPQIGVSRFRIDLAIVHPDRPGDYLVGIECDGATYHSAATARDRDKVRAAILKDLGWQLLRVWSTDWWVDKAGALVRLDEAIRSILQTSRLQDGLAMDTDDDEPGIVTDKIATA
ncbi:very-short-patch-repair endonuclease [Chitinivorax tropicus]|uniref:Very-short-patch-repair endonuclease n=1 Tax=Chitinivorax tropicus TaxID=714531 RepID=A0A840MLW0_9PROT|nr:DUF4011 domain-containing protein [Chitinivorax tropicus]MBB5017183.1 very-short-patch-repair endonuclease [Chitinivorax tropicus]